MSGGQKHYQLAPTKEWDFPAYDKDKKQIDFIYGGSKFRNSVNSIKAYQRKAENNIGIRVSLSGPNHEITFDENETADLDKLHVSTKRPRNTTRHQRLRTISGPD